jgi:hypothetical protein
MKTLTTTTLATFRSLTGYALLAAAPFAFAAQAAFAQSEPPQGAPATTRNTDPPGRVARLNYMAGAVTTEPAGATDWSYASVNRPLTTGDQLWNDQGARSEIHIGSTAVRLGESTSLDILNLDDSNAQLKVAQGTLSTRVRALPPGVTYEIDTPNVAVGVTGPGDYRVDVAPDGSTTTVTVRSGTLTVYGDGGQLPLSAGQQIRFAGTDLQQVADNGLPPPDAFDQWAANRDAAEDRSVSARYVSRDVPGYQDLDANGSWRSDPQYGDVWVPHAVPVGWAPYHNGHWVWQAPWGWTWVDDAPWGFAPYHYGRWAYAGESWCWVPGPIVVTEPPVYAPALVAFVGGDSHFSWGVNLAIGGAAAAGVAWFPLGPGEAWHPRGGDWSPRYFQRVNQTTVINNVNVNNTVNVTHIHNTYVNYRAPGAVTAVPATAFVHGQPVGRFAQRVDPRQWRNAQINPGGPGIAPVRESFASGQRHANYRPPQALVARPVVATRNPVVPAAYHDRLAQRFAQSGGQVPGAGQAVVRTAPPARFAAQQPRGMTNGPAAAAHNVRVVDPHSPAIERGHGPATPNPAQAAQHPGEAAPNGARPMPGQPLPHTPLAAEHQQPNNGVPRPPQALGNANGGAQRGAREAIGLQQPGAQGPARHEPAWTQPHTPMGQQRAAQAAQPQPPRQDAHVPQVAQPPRQDAHVPQVAQPPRQDAHVPQVAQPPRQDAHVPQVAQPLRQDAHVPQVAQPPRQDAHVPQVAQPLRQDAHVPQVAQPPRQDAHVPQVAQPPRQDAHVPQVAQPPRQEFHAQQAQPRPEYHPPAVQQQPRAEYHPPAVQQQPRAEYHPPVIQPPRPEPQPHPPAQVQQPHNPSRPEQHSGAGRERPKA